MSAAMSFDELRMELANQVEAKGSVIVAISGFGGAGKSTLTVALAEGVEHAEVVSTDDFSLGQQRERCPDWASIDRHRLVREVLHPARSGTPISYQPYDWPKDCLGESRTVPPSPLLLVEGIGLIHPATLSFFDLTVWIDCQLEIASERGRRRDLEIYEVDHDALWRDIWTPNDRDYFALFRPDKLADVIYVSPTHDREQSISK
jgi:uridine kinase